MQKSEFDPDDDDCTMSPNFGRILPYHNLRLHKDEPLLWPFVVIKYYDQENSSTEKGRVVIPMFLYADYILDRKNFDERKFKLARAILLDNPTADL